MDKLMKEIIELSGCEILDEMAQKQGMEDNFLFYTLDDEYVSHKPHIHVCVHENDSRFSKVNRNPIKRDYHKLCTIIIPPSCEINESNLQIEEDYGNQELIKEKYKKGWIKFLNSSATPYKNVLEKSLVDYMMSNCNIPYTQDYLDAYKRITHKKYDPNSLNPTI